MIELILRIIRHALTPLIVWLVSQGYFPAELQGDVVEIVIIVIAAGATLAWSYFREITIKGRTIAEYLKGPPEPD